MGIQQSTQDILDKIDSATNDLADEIQNLSTKPSTGMSQEDVNDLNTRLAGVAEKLRVIGSKDDPNVVKAQTPATPTPETFRSTTNPNL